MKKLLDFEVVLMLIVFAVQGKAQSSQDKKPSAHEGKSATEIAQELANPNTTLGTMNFNLDY